MNHQFDIEHAQKYGIEEAILISNFQFWIIKNMANGKHRHDGRTWTYNSKKAMTALFPYMTEAKIRRAIESLISQGVLITGNYNSSTYDRTLWYAFSDESIFTNGQIHLSETANGSDENSQPIPDIKPAINQVKKPYILAHGANEQKSRFSKPTLDQVAEYCQERGNTVDPQRFIDHYESVGWKVGRSAMKDWRASVRTWEKNEKPVSKPKKRLCDDCGTELLGTMTKCHSCGSLEYSVK